MVVRMVSMSLVSVRRDSCPSYGAVRWRSTGSPHLHDRQDAFLAAGFDQMLDVTVEGPRRPSRWL